MDAALGGDLGVRGLLMSRYARKVDSNHAAIVKELKRLGASVLVISCSETGAPDLLVGFRGADCLAEVKSPGRLPSTPQLDWASKWKGRHVALLTSKQDCRWLILSMLPQKSP